MKYRSASICVIGTELTQGIITDKHCKLISTELTKLGIHINDMNIVNDDGSIEKRLSSLIEESDIVLVTGGLGPTSDDMTRSSIANVASVKLYQDRDCYDTLYKRVGSRINGANGIQAMIPETFTPVENPLGTAPGFLGFIKRGDRLVAVAAMPGPPRELNQMFYHHILPWIANLSGQEELEREEYSTFLVCESKLEELCQKHKVGSVVWGTRFQEFKISLFLSGGTAQERNLMFNRLEEDLGKGLILKENTTALDSLVRGLNEDKESLSCSESCTGGLCSKLLTDKSGSSSYFYGGVVSYANEAKITILGVNESTLKNEGAVSKATVIEMAENINKLSGSSYSFSTSGVAGPLGGTEVNPVGTVWFGFASKDKSSQAVCLHFVNNGRDSIRRRSATAAFLLLRYYRKGYTLLDIISKWEYI